MTHRRPQSARALKLRVGALEDASIAVLFQMFALNQIIQKHCRQVALSLKAGNMDKAKTQAASALFRIGIASNEALAGKLAKLTTPKDRPDD